MPRTVFSIPFSKYSGAGNDFAIVAEPDARMMPADALARLICPRRTGVGVDGFILVQRLASDRVAARFFNPDGSEFSTCGNGTRCVARFARHRGLTSASSMDVETAGGVVRAVLREEGVALDFELDARIEGTLSVPVRGDTADGWRVRIGTPHLVVPIARMPDGDIRPLAEPIRFHPELGPEGTNVDFVARHGRSDATIRTYERGVEGETLACGSGAMAAALVLHRAGLTGETVRLHTRSGEDLRVTLLDAGAAEGSLQRIRLEGPARRIFDGEYPVVG